MRSRLCFNPTSPCNFSCPLFPTKSFLAVLQDHVGALGKEEAGKGQQKSQCQSMHVVSSYTWNRGFDLCCKRDQQYDQININVFGTINVYRFPPIFRFCYWISYLCIELTPTSSIRPLYIFLPFNIFYCPHRLGLNLTQDSSERY